LKWIEKEEEIKVISRRNPAVRSDSLLSVSHTQRAGTDGYGMQEAERRMDFTDSLKISEDSRTSSQQSSRPAREEKQRVLLLSGKTTPQLSLPLSLFHSTSLGTSLSV
jgi:hypothetical protein